MCRDLICDFATRQFTIPETEAALILLVDLLKSIDNLPTVAAVEAQINARKAAFADTYDE